MKVLALAALAMIPVAAHADMVITEWMYSGTGGEFVEFTNTGPTEIDLTGWSFDDDSRIPGELDLSAFGPVQPGESVVITEDPAATFIADWGLSGVKVIGEYTNRLGRNDEINLYDAADNLVDRLTYGDEDFPGSIRTKDASGNVPPPALGANDCYAAVLSSAGDGYGSYASSNGDVGNPGVYVPEPASLAVLALGALAMLRRRPRA